MHAQIVFMRSFDEIKSAIQNGEDVSREELMKFWHYGGIDKFFGNEDGSLYGSIKNVYNDVTGKTAQDDVIAAQKEMQEDAQDFAHSERVDQNDWELQLHKMQLLDDPTLQMQGLKAIGMSDAAAAQAILGSQGSFGIGAASNGAAPMGSVSPVPPQSGLADLLSSIPYKIQDVKKSKSSQAVDWQNIKESNKRIEQIANQIHVDNETLDLAKKLNESTIALNKSITEINVKELNVMEQKIKTMMAEAGLFDSQAGLADAQAAKEFAYAGLLNKQTEFVTDQLNNEINKKMGQMYENQAGYYSAMDKGQAYENVALRCRAEVARVFGFDDKNSLNAQVVECIAQGKFGSIPYIIASANLDHNQPSDYIGRTVQSLLLQLFGINGVNIPALGVSP